MLLPLLVVPEEFQSYLGFESTVSEILETVDGSNFTPNCALSYTDTAAIKASGMMTEISGALAGSGCSDIVTSVTHLPSFTTAGNMVSFMRIVTYI